MNSTLDTIRPKDDHIQQQQEERKSDDVINIPTKPSSSTTLSSSTTTPPSSSSEPVPSLNLPSIDKIQTEFSKKGANGLFDIYCNTVENIMDFFAGQRLRNIGTTSVSKPDLWKSFLRVILPTSCHEDVIDNSKSPLLSGLTMGMLTTLASFGLMLCLTSNIWRIGFYITTCAAFHIFEYMVMCAYHPTEQDYVHYAINLGGLQTRYSFIIEHILWGFLIFRNYNNTYCNSTFKTIISSFGILLIIFGQFIRTGAMISLGQHFSYNLGHGSKLIQTGFHSLVRHPSYLGVLVIYFGVSFLLLTPLSFIGQLLTFYPILKGRVEEEETMLIKMYPNEYPNYMKTTPRFIPQIDTLFNFIKTKMLSSSSSSTGDNGNVDKSTTPTKRNNTKKVQ